MILHSVYEYHRRRGARGYGAYSWRASGEVRHGIGDTSMLAYCHGRSQVFRISIVFWNTSSLFHKVISRGLRPDEIAPQRGVELERAKINTRRHER